MVKRHTSGKCQGVKSSGCIREGMLKVDDSVTSRSLSESEGASEVRNGVAATKEGSTTVDVATADGDGCSSGREGQRSAFDDVQSGDTSRGGASDDVVTAGEVKSASAQDRHGQSEGGSAGGQAQSRPGVQSGTSEGRT